MRNRKTILLLLLALVALVAAEVALNLGGRKIRMAARTVLVENAADCMALTLSRRGEPQTALVRDGGRWRLRRPFAATAEEPVVLKLLDQLAHAPVEETISDAELFRFGRTRADFALDDPPLRVSLSNATACVSVSFGLLTPSGDGVYAAVDGERAVLIVPSSVLAAVDLPVDRLRRRRLFGFGESMVTAFDVKQRPGAILSFAREGNGWRVGADRASEATVSQFLRDLTTMEAQSFVWPTGATNEVGQASAALLAGYGLDPETSVTVTIKRSVGRNSSISFGKRAGETTVYALVHNGGTVVTVPAALRDAALQETARFADTRLFRETAEQVSALTLSEGATSLALVRAGRASWRLESPISAPADAEAVEALVARVLALSSADLDSNGVALSLGADVTPVVVARAALFPDGGGFERFRAKEIVDFPADEIRRLVSTVGEQGAAIVFARDRRVWNVESAGEGAVVSSEGVARVLKALSPLRALRVERLKVSAAEFATYGLERPALKLAVDLNREDAVRRNILVGAATPDGGRYATVGSADAVFVISDEAATALSSPLVERP